MPLATIFAWHPSTLSCIAEIKGRHKDGIRSIIAPENADCIWTGGDDKDAGIQVYTTVEQGLELSSFVGAPHIHTLQLYSVFIA